MKFEDSLRTCVSLPRTFRESLDNWAKATGQTRSSFIRDAVRYYTNYLVEKNETNPQES